MGRVGFLSTAAILVSLSAGQGLAQRAPEAPAEVPPASYTGNQYVDSRGCVFIRAGIGGVTTWVARLTSTRQPLCGFQPSLTAEQRTAPAPDAFANVPNPLAMDQPAPRPAAETTQPAPEPRTPAPTVTASAPAPRAANPQPTPAVQSAPAPSPQVIRQPVAPTPAAAPEPRTITRAEACSGRSGVQPNMISSRTGQPIDCGPAPQVAAAAPPAQVVPPATVEPVRMTRAQACDRISATGQQLINASNGLPVRCGPQTQPITTSSGAAQQVASVSGQAPARTGSASAWDRIVADFNAPQAPYSNPLDAPPGSMAMPRRGPNVASAAGVPGMGTVNTPTARVPGLGTVNTPTARVPGMGTVNTPTAVAPGTAAGYGLNPTCPTYGDARGFPVRCGPQAQSPSAQTVVVPDGVMGNLGLGPVAAVIGGALVLGLIAGAGNLGVTLMTTG